MFVIHHKGQSYGPFSGMLAARAYAKDQGWPFEEYALTQLQDSGRALDYDDADWKEGTG